MTYIVNIINKENCSGCKACYNICPQNCIKMVTDVEGFWYPKVNKDDCISCGLCEKVCPELKIYSNVRSYDSPTCYAAWNTNKDIRGDSSSGGVFTSIAESIISNDGVVFGAGYNSDLNVIHKEANTLEGLKQLRGSKYVQSDINDTFKKAKDYLKEGKKVLFVGTPCQIAGIYSFLQIEYEQLYTCDIVCHGVPSPIVFEKYKENLELQYDSSIKEVTFRDKKTGWKNYSVSIHFDKDLEYSKTFGMDAYMMGFLRNYYLRPSCYKCSYVGIPRVSDITLGDFWGIAGKYPELDDDKGTSLIFINTDKGNTMLEGCKDNIFSQKCDLGQAIQGNPSIVSSVDIPSCRDKFFKDLNDINFNFVIKKYMSPPSWFQRKVTFSKRALRFVKRKIVKLVR
ncbi:Coenzyme F420 hydrogenase/dehydrogenase, beta subunit C-terminal domain [Clostridium algoriphilum]|uniref:Coenzyme F420 hydrogenase/dehydrogenase, beta subunit C-terminal domain n=1 Tax=Clostridium algoriphilum TaxID=198347 RepID=UPI001CF34FF9|nr:Coenzyme F420 hydrogenase/dehydrogenase, beta subunit C-terminal domain [Clostridium algoriphilum]MCB2293961.1 Coenzyme F420 hydrogenase/dehydrogenase, beta subunit C-terminal domain [Clostridium algoriphilum]